MSRGELDDGWRLADIPRRWTLEDTIVITDRVDYMKAQPLNYILTPSFHYRVSAGVAANCSR